MSMLEQVTQAIARVPVASALDEETTKAIARAVVAELKNPTMHMIVHADDQTMFIDERRVAWFQYLMDAALIELA